MNMIERVAKAICDNDPTKKTWEDQDAEGKAQFLWITKGVLLEMREPTDEMLDAASKEDGAYAEDTAPAEVHWRAMIDAALAR